MGEGGHTYGLIHQCDSLKSLHPIKLLKPITSVASLPMTCRKVQPGSCKGSAHFPTKPDGAYSWLWRSSDAHADV